MTLLNFTAGTTTAGSAVPITSTFITNSDVSVANNAVTVNNPGVYEIEYLANATSTASSAATNGIQITANGNAVGVYAQVASSAAAAALVLEGRAVIKVIGTTASTNVTITFVSVGAPTIVNGQATIKKII